jgi:hypothetical protein
MHYPVQTPYTVTQNRDNTFSWCLHSSSSIGLITEMYLNLYVMLALWTKFACYNTFHTVTSYTIKGSIIYGLT